MKWDEQSVQSFLTNREYIDTVLIPIAAIHAGGEIRDYIRNATFVTRVAQGVEERLKGRLLLLPAVTYHANSPLIHIEEMLEAYVYQLHAQQFEHIIIFMNENQCSIKSTSTPATFIRIPDVPEEENGVAPQLTQYVQKYVQTVQGLWK